VPAPIVGEYDKNVLGQRMFRVWHSGQLIETALGRKRGECVIAQTSGTQSTLSAEINSVRLFSNDNCYYHIT
jgi:hypothetical protein